MHTYCIINLFHPNPHFQTSHWTKLICELVLYQWDLHKAPCVALWYDFFEPTSTQHRNEQRPTREEDCVPVKASPLSTNWRMAKGLGANQDIASTLATMMVSKGCDTHTHTPSILMQATSTMSMDQPPPGNSTLEKELIKPYYQTHSLHLESSFL